MRAHDLLRWLRYRPFRPFRLLVTTGVAYDVLHPELMLVGNSTITLELSDPKTLFFAARREVEISLAHIVQLQEIPSTSPPAVS